MPLDPARALRPLAGAAIPLFERFIQDAEPGREPPRTLDREGLLESVRREVGRILNTRCQVAAGELAPGERTTIDYGLPDIAPFFTAAGTDQARAARLAVDAITAFEPRLRNVGVGIRPEVTGGRGLIFQIDALLVVGDVVEPISFPIVGPDVAGTEAG
ncbi:MAG: type VI secretion system baseplate subunit TssE [Gemmatimonadales bacterium]|nr:type VI secretion system baseplate subunit TssE [Gemmatimonadales bacterium]